MWTRQRRRKGMIDMTHQTECVYCGKEITWDPEDAKDQEHGEPLCEECRKEGEE